MEVLTSLLTVHARNRYIDNQDVLDLLEKKRVGLLPLLDDEGKMLRGTDETYVAKCTKAHPGSKRFAAKNKFAGNVEFTINHYAGEVSYSAVGFLQKNKDKLLDNLEAFMATSGNDLVSTRFTAAASTGRKTQSFQFREQLSTLATTLNGTVPHYVRCVKANSQKQPDIFEGPMCLVRHLDRIFLDHLCVFTGCTCVHGLHEEIRMHVESGQSTTPIH